MTLLEDRLWRVLFLALSVATLFGIERIGTATHQAAAVVPVFQAIPPEPCPCDKQPKPCDCDKKPKLELIQEPQR